MSSFTELYIWAYYSRFYSYKHNFACAAFIGFGYVYRTYCSSNCNSTITINKMGLATSTFYIFADFGAGMGPFILGIIIPFIGYRQLYMAMGMLVIIALFCITTFTVECTKSIQQKRILKLFQIILIKTPYKFIK